MSFPPHPSPHKYAFQNVSQARSTNMAATRATYFIKPSSFSFSVQAILRCNAKSISSAAKPSTQNTNTSKSQKSTKKEANMGIQNEYRDAVKNVVTRFRDERLENLRLRQAAEGEQQKLLEREKVEEKRIIEGVKMENEKLEQLRLVRGNRQTIQVAHVQNGVNVSLLDIIYNLLVVPLQSHIDVK